jgi:Ion channel
MPILLLDVLRAIWALRHDRGFVVLAVLTVVLVAGGGVFYSRVEELRPLDAVYLSVITLTTVGYGDVAPATDAGKIFTSGFVIVGMGILVGFVATLAGQLRARSMLHRPLTRLSAGRGEAQASPEPAEYDVLVIGSSDASRRVGIEAAGLGLRVVFADAEQVLGYPRLGSATSPMRAAGTVGGLKPPDASSET